MRKKLVFLSLAVAAAAAWAAVAGPEEAAEPEKGGGQAAVEKPGGKPVAEPVEKAGPSEKAEPPSPVLEIGVEERGRAESYNNLHDWDAGARDVRHQFRFRTRLWATAPVGRSFSFYVGLNDESRKITAPDTDFKLDELIFEHAYADVKLGRRVSARVGRQDIFRGEGFILADGTPGDGSRTFYFNAVDLAVDFGPKRKLELLGISDPHEEVYLPVVNDRHRDLVEWAERAFGAYYTDSAAEGTSWEAYYFYKQETKDYRPATNPQHQPERRLSTLGARVVQRLGAGLSLTGELAGQWGHQKGGVPIRAWGGYAYLKKEFAHPWKPSAQFGYVALSGDDPEAPGKIGGWDPIFSRWPRWSEGYVYSFTPEKGIGYWTNLKMFQAELVIYPNRFLKVKAGYLHMGAFHPFGGSPEIFGAGTTRGDVFLSRLDLAINGSWKVHVIYEAMLPGSFYSHGDDGEFFRFELTYTFRKKFRLPS